MPNEFELIKKYFTRAIKDTAHVHLSVGDDAALLQIPKDHQWVTSIDTSVKGVHYPTTTDAYSIGYKSLAVSLSDMAAMGALPKSALLSLGITDANERWLSEFSQGFCALLDEYNVDLIGGDMVSGYQVITTVVNGIVPTKKALTRTGAKVGDVICVSGYLGEAALALLQILNNKATDKHLLQTLNQPPPRVKLGLALREIASSCIDTSDGLLADLDHICKASKVGAVIEQPKLPLSSTTLAHVDKAAAVTLALSGGDDYELCFTLAKSQVKQLQPLSQQLDLALTVIGEITSDKQIKILDANNKKIEIDNAGFKHF